MDRVKTARKKVRTTVTKTITTVETELAKDAPDLDEVEVLFQTLEELSVKLAELNEEMTQVMLDAECTDEEHEAESDLVQEYSNKIKRAKNKLTKKLHPLPKSPTPSESSHVSVTDGGSKNTFKLPKIELKKFSGDLTEWLGWWAQFKKVHEREDLHDTDKFQYLVQCMVPGSSARALVDRYPQSRENYPKVVEALKERFGKEKLLRQVYIRELIKMIINKGRDNSGKLTLSTLYDKLDSHLRSLESLGAAVEPKEFLFPMVESSLPEDILIAWQRSPYFGKDGSKEKPVLSELDYLMQFLKTEIDSEQQRSLAKAGFGLGSTDKKKDVNSKKKFHEDDDVPTAAGLFSGNESKGCCVFCEKKHHSEKCYTAQKMSLEERKSKLFSKKACFKCFKVGHRFKECKTPAVKCILCGQYHQPLLCPGNSTSKGKPLNSGAQEFQPTIELLNCTSEVILQTLIVNLRNEKNGREKVVRVLIDSGSQRSYMLKKTSEKLGFQPIEKITLHHMLFGGNHLAGKKHNLLDVNLYSTVGTFSTEMKLLDQDKICRVIPRVGKGPWLTELRQSAIVLSNISPENPIEIEVLIGANNLGTILTGKVFHLSNGLTATETCFGWTLMGKISEKEISLAMSVLSLSVSSASVADFWKLEAIGITDPIESQSKKEREAAAKSYFTETVRRENDGRYSVSLPWIDGKKLVPNNKVVAEKRLISSTNKLKVCEKYEEYEDIFTAWTKEGIISICSNEEDLSSGQHYLPHRAVFKPESKTIPIRPVFDASCRSGRTTQRLYGERPESVGINSLHPTSFPNW